MLDINRIQTDLQARQVFIPLDGQQVFLFVVASLAGGDDVAFDGFATPDNRHKVVHGEFFWRYAGIAVVTSPAGELSLPPGACAQNPSCAALPLYFFVRYIRHKRHYFRPLLTSSSS